MLVAGFAMSVNSMLLSVGLQERWIRQAASGAPLTVIVAAVIGPRAAFRLPTNLPAAWIFRFSQEATSRSHHLDVVNWGDWLKLVWQGNRFGSEEPSALKN